MRATAEPMEGNLVRLSVEIDEPEFDRALGDVVRTLARQVRVPGFRPGKAPRKVLEARLGGAAELEVVERPAIDGDMVTIDLHGNDASGAEVVGVDDYLYEVGSGSIVAE